MRLIEWRLLCSGAEDYFTHKVQAYLDLHDDDIPNGISPAYGYEQEYSTHLYTRKAVGAIEQHAATNGASSPLFMYLAYQAIHSPDEAPSSYSDRFSETIPNTHRRTVAGMVAALDEGIGNVTEALKENGMLEHTTIVFTTGCSESLHTAFCTSAAVAHAVVDQQQEYAAFTTQRTD